MAISTPPGDHRPTSTAVVDLPALAAALLAARVERGVSAAAMARKIGVAPSTIARLVHNGVMEADGVLAMIRWLGVPPEHFVVPQPGRGRVLDPSPMMVRADASTMFRSLDEARIRRGLDWATTANQVGVPLTELAGLSRGGRTTIGTLASVAVWLDVPIATLTRAANG